MNGLWAEVFVDLTDGERALRAIVRLTVAAALGAVLGFERQTEGKVTSARMHMIVALGAALVTFLGAESDPASASRVIQGVITGIGFLGAGAIMKEEQNERVHGLTTAASVWLTAGVGMAVGSGYLWPAVYGVGLGWVVLSTLRITKTKLSGPDEEAKPGRHRK